MKKASMFFPLLVILTALAIGTQTSYTFPTYSRDEDATNCRLCHGSFYRDSYVSNSDGQNWGSLHDLHRFVMLEEDSDEVSKCHVCHMPGRPQPPVHTDESGSEYLDPISCVGCHGRYEDAGNDNRSEGLGEGLRQHHTSAGVAECLGCHVDANPANDAPVGENLQPPNYFTPDDVFTNKPTDSCNSFGEENYAGTWEGIDNDGDGFYDALDFDCKPPFAKMLICHIPHGNPTASKTVSVNAASLSAHLNHGDIAWACEDLFQNASVFRGGRLYDKFWAETGSMPTTDHQLWSLQSSNTRTGSDTWRCKECHGWDYKGQDGAYGPGSSHFTGFAGIFGTTLSPQEVVNLLANPAGHNFLSQGLTYADLWDLAKFVVAGQIDTDTIIVGNLFTGDPNTGMVLFEDTMGDGPGCAACHDNDGLRTPPRTSTNAGFDEYPQVIAMENPWEFQHKARYGQPGTAMRGIMIFGGGTQEANDIGAHAQQNLIP